MVVKSEVKTITVTSGSQPPPSNKIKVLRVDIGVGETNLKLGQSTFITGWVTLADTVPYNKTGYVNLTLKYKDPNGIVHTGAVRYVKISGGQIGSETARWTFTPNKAGNWEVWIESDDYATVV